MISERRSITQKAPQKELKQPRGKNRFYLEQADRPEAPSLLCCQEDISKVK